MRRTALQRGRGARTKGGSAEREVVAILHAHGFYRARRNFQSGGQGGGDITGVPGVHLEVKRQERVCIWDWIAQAEHDARPTDVAAVVFRRSRSGWYAVVGFEDLLGLLGKA
jgi:hypothetical protein